MVQHLLITLVVPPLLLLGTPGWMLRPLLRRGPVRRAARTLLAPIAAFMLFNAVFALWHVPIFYEASLRFEPAHAFEHAAFAGLALLAWWPVFGPMPEFPRLPYGAQVVYLFMSSLPPTIVGAIIALAERPLYPTYWAAPRVAGIDPFSDQQAAGLIMWIPGALAYFVVLTVVFFLWLDVRGAAESRPYGTVNPDRARLRATKTNAGGTLRHT
jgi:putative membrane protein